MDHSTPPTLEDLCTLVGELEGAAYRWGALSGDPGILDRQWDEARIIVRARRIALLRALQALNVARQAPLPAPYRRRAVAPEACGHLLVADTGTDYMSCPDCGLPVVEFLPRT